MPHIEVTAHHQETPIHPHLTLQPCEASHIRTVPNDGGEIPRANAIASGIRAGITQRWSESSLNITVGPGIRVVTKHSPSIPLILNHPATGFVDITRTLKSPRNRRGHKALEVNRGIGVRSRNHAAKAGRVTQREERLGCQGTCQTYNGEGHCPDLQGTIRGGGVWRRDNRTSEVNVLEVGGKWLEARSKRSRQETVTRGGEKERL